MSCDGAYLHRSNKHFLQCCGDFCFRRVIFHIVEQTKAGLFTGATFNNPHKSIIFFSQVYFFFQFFGAFKLFRIEVLLLGNFISYLTNVLIRILAIKGAVFRCRVIVNILHFYLWFETCVHFEACHILFLFSWRSDIKFFIENIDVSCDRHRSGQLLHYFLAFF